MARFAVGLSLCLLVTSFAFAQADPAAGILPFSTQAGAPYDSLDLATGSITLSIPVRSKTGKIPFSFTLVGNSHAYTYPNVNNHNLPTWAVSSGSTSAFVLIGRERLIGTGLTSSTRTITCGSDTKDTESYNFAVIDSFGSAHPLPSTIKVDNDKCDTPPATGVTTDGSGYTMQVSNFSVWNRSGIEVFNNSYNPVVTDPDGAKESVTWNGSTATYTDSLNTTVLTEVLGGGGPDTYTYLGGDGSSNDGVTVEYTAYHQKTAFGCYQDIDYYPLSFPSTITVKGGGTFTISYETTPGYVGQKDSNGLSYVTGRIASITYPSGGSVTYGYSGGNNGVNCSSKVVPTLTRTVNDNNGNNGTWTYVNSNTSSPAANFTVTETDPAQNQAVHYFSGEYQTAVWAYQGQSTGGYTGALRVTTICYNGNLNNGLGKCQSPSSIPALPITQTDAYTWVGVAPQSLVETTFDNYGNTTKISRYDWGAAIPPSAGPPPISTESVTYTGCGVSSSLYILDKPCSDTVLNSTGGTTRQTNLTYTSTGHPISVSRWVSGTKSLTSTAHYNTNGTLQWSKDAAGNQTSYGYAATGSGGCNSLLLTSTTYPLTSVGSDSQAWDCNGGVLTSRTDVNGKTTTFAYSDPLYRLTQITYPDSNSHIDTYAYHTGTNYPWYTYWTKASTSNASLTGYSYVDGLGRSTTNETDDYSWQVTTYNNLGQVYTVSNPYLTTSDPTYGLTTYAYDAIGRVTKVTNPQGDATSITYASRAKQVNGLYGLNRILQVDGLGNLVSVCDGIGAPTQANGATIYHCGQDIPANGFLATYGYDSVGHLTSVNYVGQTRSFGPYDGLAGCGKTKARPTMLFRFQVLWG